jgi:hypothetical protein
VTVDDIDAAFAHLTCCEAQIVEPVRQIRPGVRLLRARAGRSARRGAGAPPRRDDFSLESLQDGTMSTARAALLHRLSRRSRIVFTTSLPVFTCETGSLWRSRPPARRASANRLRLREPRQYRRDARSARPRKASIAPTTSRDCAARSRSACKREALAAGTIFGAEPCIYGGITTFAKGHPYYRGRDTIALAQLATLEDVATLLWNARAPVSFPFDDDGPALQGETRGRQCAFTSLAALAANGHSTLGRTDAALHAEAGQLVATVAQGLRLRAATRVKEGADTPIHARLAQGWGQDASGAELIRKAMVLVADHEITSSAFAARITASTGASLPGCLLTVSRPFRGRCTATPPGACAPSSTT